MGKIRFNLYPSGQMKRYLLVDIVVCVFFFYKVLSAESGVSLSVTLLLLGIFLALYYAGLWFRDWRLLAAVLAGCGLMASFAALYEEWLLLFAAVFADFLGRVRSRAHLAAGLAAFPVMHAVVSFVLYQDALHFVRTIHLPFLIIQMAIPFVVRTLEKSESLKHELASANERIALYAQEEERHRLARDLHDTLGQTLTMIKMKSELAMRTMDKNPERAKAELQEVVRSSRAALKQVRDVVTAMRHVPLEQELELGRRALEASGIGLEVAGITDRPPLSKTAETMLALAVRECLTNVVKHSRARRCVITERCADGWYELHIEDDGIGMAGMAAGRPDQPGHPEGHGLSTMRERMRLLQGEARIGPSPIGGVRVTLAIPVPTAGEEVTA